MWTSFMEWCLQRFSREAHGYPNETPDLEDDETAPVVGDTPVPDAVEDAVTAPLVPPTPLFHPPTAVTERRVEPAVRASSGIRTVGAWCGSQSLRNPARDVDFARRTGINRLDIIVNDHSGWRAPRDFDIYEESRIARLADLARDAGIEVHFMSWIMPHERYLKVAVERLVPLADAVGAKSIQWDAEEPWTKAQRPMNYKDAAMLLKEAVLDTGTTCRMGVNGIGYASVAKLGPLADVCDYVVPQAYSTSTSGVDPKRGPPVFYERWHERFHKPIVMGLAAYRQKGIPGYATESAAMQAAIDATRHIPEVDTVIYWSLVHLRKSPEVAKVVEQIRKHERVDEATPIA